MASNRTQSVADLNPLQKEKFLKFGRLNYEYCRQTGQRLADFDKSVYDVTLDCFFVNADERLNWYKEERSFGKKAVVKKSSTIH